MYKKFIKRLIDIVLSFIGIIVLAVPMLIIAIVIKLDSKGPVLFVQTRLCAKKKRFRILKFRTMLVEAPPESPTHALSDPNAWITKPGRFLRKTSLDELPQLFNIFVGQMSVIGPRPHLWNEFDVIEERDKYGANDVRPGLTGWAQINGRDELCAAEKAALDGEYVKKMSFLFDCKCFFGTIKCVLKSDGFAEGSAGIEKVKKEQSADDDDKREVTDK